MSIHVALHHVTRYRHDRRVDGQPCWRDPTLWAVASQPERCTSADAQRFATAPVERLGVGAQRVQPGYEDHGHDLWREGRLPLNVSPSDARLDDEMARAHLRRVFGQGLGHVVGCVLPLAREQGRRWVSGPWPMRGGHRLLLPGDSPMGYRLPLASLPWVRSEDHPCVAAPDPFAPRAPLAPHAALLAQRPLQPSPGAPVAARTLPKDVVRTALVVKVRDPARVHGPQAELERAPARSGLLHVVMPPVETLDDWLALLAAVEATAAACRLRIVLAGDLPPRDPRLATLRCRTRSRACPSARRASIRASPRRAPARCAKASWHTRKSSASDNALPGAAHVRLGCGRDCRDVTPLRGVIRSGGRHQLTVSVQTRCVAAAVAEDLRGDAPP